MTYSLNNVTLRILFHRYPIVYAHLSLYHYLFRLKPNFTIFIDELLKQLICLGLHLLNFRMCRNFQFFQFAPFSIY